MDFTTRINIKGQVDPSVKKAGKEVAEALTPKGFRDLEKQAKAVEKEILTLTGKQKDLSKQLEKVKVGTDAYKALTKQIKATRDEATALHRALQMTDRILDRQRREARRAESDQRRATRQAEADQRRALRQAQQAETAQREKRNLNRSFFGGLAQGLGVSEYIPAEPGMGRRIAGSMIGGGFRRIAGGIATPFTNPGLGGMTQALSGVPVVGGLAANAINIAAGAAQDAIAYDRTRLHNLYFAGPHTRKYVGRGKATPEMLQERAAMRKRLTAAEMGDTPEMARAVVAFNKMNPPAQAEIAGRDDRGLGLSEVGARVGFLASGDLEQVALSAFRRAKGQRGTARGEEIRKKTLHRQKLLAQTIELQRKSDVAQAQGGLDAAEIAIELREKEKRYAIDRGLGSIDLGTKFGFGPTEAEGMKGAFFGARGGTFDQRLFNESMAAKVVHGVGMEQSGAYARGGMAGGGRRGRTDLAEVLQAAVAEGLKGSQVQEYLGTLVDLQTDAERRGVKINAQSFLNQSMQLRAAGMQGLQSQRIAGGLNQSAMDLSARGVQGPVDMTLLRAAGFTPEGGPEAYAAAMEKLEGGLDQDTLNNLLGSVAGAAGGYGGPKMQSLMFRRYLGKAGVQIGHEQASQMIAAYQGGTPPSIDALKASAESQGGSMGLVQTGIKSAGKGAGLSVAAAGVEATRIGMGYGSAGFVFAFERAALQAGKAALNFSGNLLDMAGAVKDAMGLLGAVTKGGVKGTAKRAVNAVSSSSTGDFFAPGAGIAKSYLPGGHGN